MQIMVNNNKIYPGIIQQTKVENFFFIYLEMKIIWLGFVIFN